jgi:hypothetical protein
MIRLTSISSAAILGPTNATSPQTGPSASSSHSIPLLRANSAKGPDAILAQADIKIRLTQAGMLVVAYCRHIRVLVRGF